MPKVQYNPKTGKVLFNPKTGKVMMVKMIATGNKCRFCELTPASVRVTLSDVKICPDCYFVEEGVYYKYKFLIDPNKAWTLTQQGVEDDACIWKYEVANGVQRERHNEDSCSSLQATQNYYLTFCLQKYHHHSCRLCVRYTTGGGPCLEVCHRTIFFADYSEDSGCVVKSGLSNENSCVTFDDIGYDGIANIVEI